MNAKAALLFVAACTAVANGQPQNVTAITDGWKFVRADANGAEVPTFDDSSWTAVSVPHTWNDQDALKGSSYYRGPAWYRVKLAIPESAKGKRVFVHFEAASIVADAHFNDVRLGQHRGAFTAFSYELTPYINWEGENVLAVRVDNTLVEDVAPLSGDFTMFGGIYRPVWLIIKSPVCITPLDYASPGIYLKQTKVTKEEAIVDVLAKVSNGLDEPTAVQTRVSIVPTGSDSTVVAKAEGQAQVQPGQTKSVNHQLRIENPRLWNGRKDPYMYEAKVELLRDGEVVDSVTGPIGLRYFSVDPNKGFFLNGEPYPLHGVNRHQDSPGKGWAISCADQDEDANIIMEIGATCLRLAHYPHSNYFYSLCDKNGLVVWAEIPLVNQFLDTPGFRENIKQQLVEMIRQRYNHPSIFFWGLYNELGQGGGRCDNPIELLKELQLLAKEEDLTRLTTAATDDASSKWPELQVVADLVARNIYTGWYYAKPPDMGQYIDKYRKLAGGKPVAVSEYGAGASIKQHEQNIKKGPRTDGPWHPEEWQTIVHEENYAAMEARPYVWGTYLWNMFDFSSAKRKEGDLPAFNDKGLVTADRRTRKDAFYFYKAKWTTPASSKGFAVASEPLVYITSRRHVERTDPNTPVKVYSNCGIVELKVNGQSIGSKTSEGCVFKWFDVRLKDGLNTIEAIATSDGKTCTDRCEWRLVEPSQRTGEPNK